MGNLYWHDSRKEQPKNRKKVIAWNPKTDHSEVLDNCIAVNDGFMWMLWDDLMAITMAGCGSQCSPRTAFQEWLSGHCPYIAAHMKPLSDEELDKLTLQYGEQAIRDCCEDIENRKDLRKRYTNLYRTVLNWLKRNPPKRSEQHPGQTGVRHTVRQPNQQEIAALERLKQMLAGKAPAKPDMFNEFLKLVSGIVIHHIDLVRNRIYLCVNTAGRQERITEDMIDYYDSWQDFRTIVGQCFRIEYVVFDFSI